MACGISAPQPKTEPGPWQRKPEILTTGLSGNSPYSFFNWVSFIVIVVELTSHNFKQVFQLVLRNQMSQMNGISGLSVDTVNKGTVSVMVG